MYQKPLVVFMVVIKFVVVQKPIVRWFHGVNVTCKDDMPIIEKFLQGYDVKCIETTKGIFGPFHQEVERGCWLLEEEKDLLSSGFTLVGISQGGLVARGVLQTCSVGKFVKRLLTFGSPHNGVAIIPQTQPDDVLNKYIIELCYRKIFEEVVGVCGYIKSLRYYSEYINSQVLLIDLNNERTINEEYRDRIGSLDIFMNVQFLQDNIVQPHNSSVFGYYKDLSYTSYTDMEELPIYTENRLGLRQLESAGRLFTCSLPGGHVQVSDLDIQRLLVDFANINTRDYMNHIDYLKSVCKFSLNEMLV